MAKRKTEPNPQKLLALQTGERGEERALRWAEEQGWRLHGRRLRVAGTEVDLAMLRPIRETDLELLLLEVKTSLGAPVDHAGRWSRAQQARLWRAAEVLLEQCGACQVQVGLVLVTLGKDREHLQWLRAEMY